MKFTIDRSKWRCGGILTNAQRGFGPIRLLNTSGFRCCLGQVSKQCGVPDDDMLNMHSPFVLEEPHAPLIPMLIDGSGESSTDSRLSQSAMELNDRADLSDAEREADLTALFAEHGHEIEFVGEYVIPEAVS